MNREVHALCSFDKEYLMLGLSHYYVGILKYSHESGLYTLYRTIRLEKAHNIEGNILHLEKVNHLQGWFACITFRSFRIFKIVSELKDGELKLHMPCEYRKVLRDSISLGFLKLQ